MSHRAGSGTSEVQRAVDDGTVSVADDVREIARMRNEPLAEALVTVGLTSIHIKNEVIEESITKCCELVDTIYDVKNFAVDKLCYFPKYMLRKTKEHLRDLCIFGPVSPNFNFAALSVGHFWAVVVLTSKCLGEVFASTFVGHTILSFLFAKTILFTFFIYAALPAFAVVLNMKTPNKLLTMADRRLLILILAFIIGAGTHHLLLNWRQPEFAPPPFYSPVVVALLFEFVCPRFTSDRRLFLLSSVGVAGIICFAYGLQNGVFNFTYFYTSVFAIATSFYNVQLLIADPKEGWGDSIEGLVLLPVSSMYNQLVMTILFGNYVANRDRQEAIPDSIEEQYSLLLWPKK
uniref:Uncharacterized protein n=2 Tax=Parascaris univalens TaxID=6257 RepID=A0A915A102_PARUN